MKDLSDGTGKLRSGVSQLEDGAKELDEGMHRFKTEAIDKIADIIENDAEEGIARFKALTQAARGYSSYSGKPEDMAGNVKFIYTTDGVF